MKNIYKGTRKIIAAILVLGAGVGLCSCLSFLSMKPADTGMISGTEVQAVKNGRNASFFIKTGNGYIMLDAGPDMKKFEASLKDTGIDANDIKWILLSHSDLDHVASLPLFPDAEIYMSRDELPLINGTTKRSLFGGNKMPEGINISSIILLSDKQEISLGGINIKCIAAPGHTPGSMMYLIGGKYLFTGDAFKITKGKIGVHPFTMDSSLSKATIERLRETINGSPVVMTSHYGIMKTP